MLIQAHCRDERQHLTERRQQTGSSSSSAPASRMPHHTGPLHKQCGALYMLALVLVSRCNWQQLQALAMDSCCAVHSVNDTVAAPTTAGPSTAAFGVELPIEPSDSTSGDAAVANPTPFVFPEQDQFTADGISPFAEECDQGQHLFAARGAAGVPAGCRDRTSSRNAIYSSNINAAMRLNKYQRSSDAFRNGLFTTEAGQTFCIAQLTTDAELQQQHHSSGAHSLLAIADSRSRVLSDILDPACEDPLADEASRAGCPNKVPSLLHIHKDGPTAAAGLRNRYDSPPVTAPSAVTSAMYQLAWLDKRASAPSRSPKPQEKPGTSAAKPGPPAAKPGPSAAKPGPSAAKPGPSAAKPGPSAAKPGPSAAKPGPSAAKPGPSAAKPGPSAAKPGPSAAKPGPSAAKPLNESMNCTRGFLQVGSQPRSLAIVLLRWNREYYTSSQLWGGRPYTSLPPPKAFSRIFTDECDKAPSVNRAYYDLTGGRITFHSKLRIPVPSGVGLPGGKSEVANVASNKPIATPTVYMDPDGVDVYNWVTVKGMRDAKGNCRDWVGEAAKLANVKVQDYNHILYLQLLPSVALCDVCTNASQCIGTCPAKSGIKTGCGCALCYAARASQTSCTRFSPPGANWAQGLFTAHRFYQGDMLQLAGGFFLAIDQTWKRFLMHEAGHNLGLTHAGSIVCQIAADGKTIKHDPRFCKPDWYGDVTSFMGGSPTQQLPAAMKYKVNWLPFKTLKIHLRGTSGRYLLRPATIRRASWHAGRKDDFRWFGKAGDLLSVRIPLAGPTAMPNQSISSYTCPCNPKDKQGKLLCPACAGRACAGRPCCTVDQCADRGLTWYYVELHMPYQNDYLPEQRGIAIHFFGELKGSDCNGARLVPTHVGAAGQAKYLLDKADPSGKTQGSKFEDKFRGVTVILERWVDTSATVYIKA